MTEHASCKTCKCEPEYVRDEFKLPPVFADADLPVLMGMAVAEYARKYGEAGGSIYHLNIQARFEFDAQYMRDKLVIVRRNSR